MNQHEPGNNLEISVNTPPKLKVHKTFSLRENSPYSVRMRENTDQNNSEYGHFSRSVLHFASTNFQQKIHCVFVDV